MEDLTEQEQRDCFASAEAKLTQEEQEVIEWAISMLIARVKENNKTHQLSRDGARQLLAKLGMFLNSQRIADR